MFLQSIKVLDSIAHRVVKWTHGKYETERAMDYGNRGRRNARGNIQDVATVVGSRYSCALLAYARRALSD